MAQRKGGLGRGLDALIPSQAAAGGGVQEVEIDGAQAMGHGAQTYTRGHCSLREAGEKQGDPMPTMRFNPCTLPCGMAMP